MGANFSRKIGMGMPHIATGIFGTGCQKVGVLLFFLVTSVEIQQMCNTCIPFEPQAVATINVIIQPNDWRWYV